MLLDPSSPQSRLLRGKPAPECETDGESSDEDDLPDDHTFDLHEYTVQSKFDQHSPHFIPAGILDRLVTRASVSRAMGLAVPTKEEDDILVHWIESEAKKVFVITTSYVKFRGDVLQRAMKLFKQNGFNDSRLPIEEWSSKRRKKSIDQHQFAVMELNSAEGGAIKPMWCSSEIYEFQVNQWKVLVPIFSTSQPNHDVGGCILPFTMKETRPKEGSFGIISRCKIHKDHIKNNQVSGHGIVSERQVTMSRESP